MRAGSASLRTSRFERRDSRWGEACLAPTSRFCTGSLPIRIRLATQGTFALIRLRANAYRSAQLTSASADLSGDQPPMDGLHKLFRDGMIEEAEGDHSSPRRSKFRRAFMQSKLGQVRIAGAIPRRYRTLRQAMNASDNSAISAFRSCMEPTTRRSRVLRGWRTR